MIRKARICLSIAGGLLAANPALGQIVPSTIPITMPTNDSLLGPVAPGAPPPSADPRDLDGVYQPQMQIGPPGGRPRGGPGGAPPGGAPGPAPAGGPPAAAAAKSGDIGPADLAALLSGKGTPAPKKRVASAPQLCKPVGQLGFGGDVNQIISTPGRITFIQEDNHVIRRVYLDQKFPAHITPTYVGYSIGHWVGDTLVIETRGLKSADIAQSMQLASITDMVETVRKIEGGKRLAVVATINGLDNDGNPVTLIKPTYDRWRSDIHLEELICESGGQFFFDSFSKNGNGS